MGQFQHTAIFINCACATVINYIVTVDKALKNLWKNQFARQSLIIKVRLPAQKSIIYGIIFQTPIQFEIYLQSYNICLVNLSITRAIISTKLYWVSILLCNERVTDSKAQREVQDSLHLKQKVKTRYLIRISQS